MVSPSWTECQLRMWARGLEILVQNEALTRNSCPVSCILLALSIWNINHPQRIFILHCLEWNYSQMVCICHSVATDGRQATWSDAASCEVMQHFWDSLWGYISAQDRCQLPSWKLVPQVYINVLHAFLCPARRHVLQSHHSWQCAELDMRQVEVKC